MGTQGMHTGFWWLTCGICPLGRPVRICKDNIKMDLTLVEMMGGA
jgi:hypothetical protein